MSGRMMELKVVSLDRVYGPVPMEKLIRLASTGRIAAHDLVRPAGTTEWLRIADVPALAASVPQRASIEDLEREIEPAGGFVSSRGRWSWGGVEMDMTPMIDVTFQLLIFFMLTHALANPPPMDVPQVTHGRGVTLEGQQLVLIDDQGRYYLGDRASDESAAGSLELLVEEVQGNARRSDGPLDVILSAHKEATSGQVRDAIEGLSRVEGLGRVMFGVEEKMQ